MLTAMLACTLMVACEKPEKKIVAGEVAKQYYDQLLAGRYEDFVDAEYQPDSIPGSYRDQLIVNAKMFVAQQQREHNGIKEVRVGRVDADTARHVAGVYLVFAYGDSTTEQVYVPMVEKRGVWLLK